MSEYRGGHIILSPSESSVFRQILNSPNNDAIVMRDASLKQAEEMQFQITNTGFSFVLPDPPSIYKSTYDPHIKEKELYSVSAYSVITEREPIVYETKECPERHEGIIYYILKLDENQNISYESTVHDMNFQSELPVLSIAA